MYYIKLSSVVVTICIVFTPMTLGNKCDSSKGFKTDSHTNFQVKYGRIRKGSRATAEKVTEAHISWDPQETLDNPNCYDIANAELQYTRHAVSEDQITIEGSGSGGMVGLGSGDAHEQDWQSISSDKKKNSGKRVKWIINIVPCFKYDFRVAINKIDDPDGESSFSDVASLNRASALAISESTYTPEVPIFLTENSSESSTLLVWKTSHCVDKYDFMIKEEGDESSDGGEYEIYNTTSSTVEVSRANLKPCTNYEATIQSFILDRYSEESSSHTFSTKPSKNTSENINLKNIDVDETYISFALTEPWEPGLNCLRDYRIEVCPNNKYSNSTCLNPKETRVMERTANNNDLETKIAELDPCTNYELRITPLFEDTHIDTFSHPFTTLPPGGEVENYVAPSPTNMEFTYNGDQSVTIEWNKSECADKYELNYQGDPEGGFQDDVMIEFTTSNSITLSTLQPCSKYYFTLFTIYNGKKSTDTALVDEYEVPPMEDSGKLIHNHIRPEIKDKTNSDQDGPKFSMSFDTLDTKLQCIKQYDLTLCEIDDQGNGHACLPTTQPSHDPQQQRRFEAEFENLYYCTNYTLEIKPHHSTVIVTPISYNFLSITKNANTMSVTPVNAVSYANGTTIISWDGHGVLCATSYQAYEDGSTIPYEVEMESQLIIDNTPPCSLKSYSIAATLDDGNKTALTTASIITKWNPDNTYSPESQNLNITVSETSVSIKWNNMECIPTYQVKICELQDDEGSSCSTDTITSSTYVGEAIDSARLSSYIITSSNEPYVDFERTDLLPCTKYLLTITPIFSYLPIVKVTTHEFKTSTPDAKHLFVTGVQAKSYHNGTTVLDWDSVQCSTSYNIYENGNEAYIIGNYRYTQYVIDNSKSCSVSNYSITAKLDNDEETGLNQASTTLIVTNWNMENHYSPPSLNVSPLATGVDVTWEGLPCIDEYTVEICSVEDEDDCTHETIKSSQDKPIHYKNTYLEQCTEYDLIITPNLLEAPGELDVESTSFTTLTTNLSPPESVDGYFNPTNSVVELKWTAVECASKYKIDQSIDGIQSEQGAHTSELKMSFDKSIERCATYSYSVTSVNGETSSEPQQISLVIPPDTQTLPKWKVRVVKKVATIDLEIPKINGKCNTRSFEISHNASGIESIITFDQGSGNNLDLTEANFEDKVKISGRIIYEENPSDNLDPKYITEIVTLQEATTTSTSTPKPTTKKPLNDEPLKQTKPTYGNAVESGPTWILINFLCAVVILKHCFHYS